ncbi:MAG: carbamoyl-phosphate synthase large subunit, partial [Oscillospiraceae bacterium]
KAANMKVPKAGGRVIMTVRDEDKPEAIAIAKGLTEMDIEILSTSGTCDALQAAGVPAHRINRVTEAHPNILDMISSGSVSLVIDTPTRGHKSGTDGFKIRRSAVEHGVGCCTAIDTARAILTVREQGRSADLKPIDITII